MKSIIKRLLFIENAPTDSKDSSEKSIEPRRNSDVSDSPRNGGKPTLDTLTQPGTPRTLQLQTNCPSPRAPHTQSPQLFHTRQRSQLEFPTLSVTPEKTQEEAVQIIEEVLTQTPQTNYRSSTIILGELELQYNLTYLTNLIGEEDLPTGLLQFLDKKQKDKGTLPQLLIFIRTELINILDLFPYDLWFIAQAISDIKQSEKLAQLIANLKEGIKQSFEMLIHHRLQLDKIQLAKTCLELPLPKQNAHLKTQMSLENTTKALTSITAAEKIIATQIQFYENYLANWSLPTTSEKCELEKAWQEIFVKSNIRNSKQLAHIKYDGVGENREEKGPLATYVFSVFDEFANTVTLHGNEENEGITQVLTLANKLLAEEPSLANSQEKNRTITLKDIKILYSLIDLFTKLQQAQKTTSVIIDNKDEILQETKTKEAQQSRAPNNSRARFSIELDVVDPNDMYAVGFVGSFVELITRLENCNHLLLFSDDHLLSNQLSEFSKLLSSTLKILRNKEKFIPKLDESHSKTTGGMYLRKDVVPYLPRKEVDKNIEKVTNWEEAPITPRQNKK